MNRTKLIDAPVGVFVFRDELVLKTEYMTNIDGVYIPDCYILSTGEKFWGGMKSTEDFKTKYNNLDVEAIECLSSAQPERLTGKWLRSGSCIFPYECDQCGDTNERATPFCPNCGAKMER